MGGGLLSLQSSCESPSCSQGPMNKAVTCDWCHALCAPLLCGSSLPPASFLVDPSTMFWNLSPVNGAFASRINISFSLPPSPFLLSFHLSLIPLLLITSRSGGLGQSCSSFRAAVSSLYLTLGRWSGVCTSSHLCLLLWSEGVRAGDITGCSDPRSHHPKDN